MTRRRAVPALFAMLATLALSGTGCSRLGGQAGGTSDAGAPAAENPASTLWVSNAGEVARFADEVPFGVDATAINDKTPVRQSPGSGEVVATLPAGAEVTKLAAHGSATLVCFDDPKDPGRHLTGWIAQSALQDSTPPPAPPTPDDVGDAAPPAPDPPQPRPPGHHHHKGRKQPRH
jgi:hypothetical protein